MNQIRFWILKNLQKNLYLKKKDLGKRNKAYKMKYFILKAVIVLLFSVLITTQNTTKEVKQQIKLNDIYNIVLQKGQTKIYTVTIKDLKKDESLFVEAASPVYDPYQIPSVTLKSENDFQQYCSEQNNQYVGICQVQNSKLKQDQKFDIQIKCTETCNLRLQVFLDEIFQIDFGNKIQINALKNMGTVEEFKIQVPLNLNFTDISLVVTILNDKDIDEGVEMYANTGDQTVNIPTSQDFQFKGNEVWGSGVGVFFSDKQIKGGDWIKVFLVIGEGVSIQFYSQAIDGDSHSILLNTDYQDFTSEDDTKLYVLDLLSSRQGLNSSDISSLDEKTIQIVFVIYSGQPTIKVGFDPEFKNYLQNYDIEGTLRYLVTPEIRKKQNFTGTIYIQVSSFWSSNYYFSTRTISDKFYKLSDGIAQLNREWDKQIQNYIYESYLVVQTKENQTKVDQIESFRIRIQIMQGNAQVGIRRCHSLQKNGTLDCILTNQSQLSNPDVQAQFDEINLNIRKDWSTYELLFQYNASQCSLYREFGNMTVYNCEFQIIVFPKEGSTKDLIYSITMFQNREEGTLKQGYTYKDFLYPQTYHYYQFELPSTQNIDQITFFLTVISGDAGIMATTNPQFKYMEINDALSNDDIFVSFLNTLTFKKDKLANKFYLAVYGYETSDITISLVVKRVDQGTSNTTNGTTGNKTQQNKTVQITTLFLSEGLSQQYTLTEGNDKINFAFNSNEAGNITIELIEVLGDVDFHLQKQGSDSQIMCNNKVQVGELKCTFIVQKTTKYFIHVTAAPEGIKTFSISYFYPATCKKYPFNLPQFVFLAAKQTQCSVYSVSDTAKSLKIITSFSTLDLLSTSVTFTIKFNGNHSISFSGRQKQIDSDLLQQYCKSDSMSNCNMEISYKGDQLWNVQFHFVVEQAGKQMALFDGVVRKVVDQKMDQKKGKFFYYEVSSMAQSIKIFTTNRDNTGYYIAATFVEELQFTASPDSLYLPYRDILSMTDKQTQNRFETRLMPKRGTSVIQIQPSQFKNYCKACVMLISVFSLEQDSVEANIFEMQVTQQETFLYLGEQKTGFLSEDQIYVYDLNANPTQQSLLSIRDLSKESDKQKDCFTVSLLEIDRRVVTRIASGFGVIPKSNSSYKLFVENKGNSICTYQLSFSSLAKPLSEINTYMPTQVKIVDSAINYFMYSHKSEDLFQILNYIKTGDLKIFAQKIGVDLNSSVENLINKNVEMFDFKSVPGDSFLEVTNSSAKFCKNCYYLIAVKGDPSVQSQMAIAKGNESIGLSTYGILKQTLKKGQKQTYAFYSIFDFNVSLPLLFGEIKLLIKSPEGKTVYNNTLKMSFQTFVARPNNTEGQYVDFYNQFSRYSIQVQAVKDSSYYISVKRRNVAMRIYEGVPVILDVQNNSTTVEFVNMNSDRDVTVLIQAMNDIPDNFNIDITAQIMKQGQNKTQKLENPVAKRSQKSFNYVFKSIKGTYFITLKGNQKAGLSLLLAKTKLTHLMSSNVNLFVQKGAFEIYTPGHNLMIVVDSCLSEVEVKASQKYEAIAGTQDNVSPSVLLQHANYGGHYVITAQNVQGQYFVEVEPKNPKDKMLYTISYYYYDRADVMPYKKVDVDSQISYQITSDKIIFILKPARLIASKQKFKIFPTYTLYISNQTNTTSMDSKCGLNVGFSLTQTTSGDNQQTIRFPVDYSTIANEVGNNTDVYYVSAKVKVRFQGQNLNSDYPPFVDLAYMKLQLTQSTHKVQIKSETTSKLKYILLWIVVPVIISLALFILALKFCIKKYKMLYPDQLVEEDREMGDSEGQMKSSENKATDSLTNT